MPGKIVSALIIVSCAFCSGISGHYLIGAGAGVLVGMAAGMMLGVGCVAALARWMRMSAERLVGGAVGILLAAAITAIGFSGISRGAGAMEWLVGLYFLVLAVLCLIGMQLGSAKAVELKATLAGRQGRRTTIAAIVDTSVIIDGRIADVCDTGFISGDLVLPEFVLRELQAIADSSEPTKRTRGRRGLDVLKKMKKQAYMNIIIDSRDYPDLKEVDQKLIQMAKDTGMAIITNDFNLNKVAEVHSIQVLNMNSLANALKPVVLPGETMKVQILKEGKESTQGIAYLDDGTMVVIENGRKLIGKTVDVTVTSVLQTTAGRMIFAAVK